MQGGVFLLRLIYGCDIPREAKIASSVEFHHHALGVVIHPNVEIGNGTIIQHHVTLGINQKKSGERAPKIGNNVFLGPYVMILGDVSVGDNAVVGAGTIVMKNIESDAIYTGCSKMVKRG